MSDTSNNSPNASDIFKKNQSIFQKMITDFCVPQIFQNDLLNELMLKFAPSNTIASFTNQQQAKIHILEFLKSLNNQQQANNNSSSQTENTSGSSFKKTNGQKSKNEKILKFYQEFKENILREINIGKELITKINPALDKASTKLVQIIQQDHFLLDIYQDHRQATLDKLSTSAKSTDFQQVAELSLKIANDLLADEQDEQKKQQLQQISKQTPEELSSQIQEQLHIQHDRLRTDDEFAVKYDLFSMLYSQSQDSALQRVLQTGKVEVIEDKESVLGIDFVENKSESKALEIAQKNQQLVKYQQEENYKKFGNIDPNLLLLDLGGKHEQLNTLAYFATSLIKQTQVLNNPDIKINDLMLILDSKTSPNSLYQKITAEQLNFSKSKISRLSN